MFFSLALANHDDALFADAAGLDVSRSNAHIHISFDLGAHFTGVGAADWALNAQTQKRIDDKHGTMRSISWKASYPCESLVHLICCSHDAKLRLILPPKSALGMTPICVRNATSARTRQHKGYIRNTRTELSLFSRCTP